MTVTYGQKRSAKNNRSVEINCPILGCNNSTSDTATEYTPSRTPR